MTLGPRSNVLAGMFFPAEFYGEVFPDVLILSYCYSEGPKYASEISKWVPAPVGKTTQGMLNSLEKRGLLKASGFYKRYEITKRGLETISLYNDFLIVGRYFNSFDS